MSHPAYLEEWRFTDATCSFSVNLYEHGPKKKNPPKKSTDNLSDSTQLLPGSPTQQAMPTASAQTRNTPFVGARTSNTSKQVFGRTWSG